MANINSIENPVWSLSLLGYGVIVEGIAAIRQRMDIAIRTTKGSDALRPEFGSLVFKFIDAPVNVAVPNIKKEILDTLSMWVPEIRVTEIKHSFQSDFNPVFQITYQLTDEDLVDKLLFDLRAGTSVSDNLNEVVLQAFFPANPFGYRYSLKFERNGVQIAPLPNPAGFGNISELFGWVNDNWFYIGRWFLLSDRLVCYMNSEGINSASLSIEVLPITYFLADFPPLSPGEAYNVIFKIGGFDVLPLMLTTFKSPGDILSFAAKNWAVATWAIEYLQPTGEGIFSDEFSDEFAVSSTGYRLTGVSHINGIQPLLTIQKA